MQNETEDATAENNPLFTRAAILAIVPSLLISACILGPFIFLYMRYIEPMEIRGDLNLPEWLATAAAFGVIGFILTSWKFTAAFIYSKLEKKQKKAPIG